jgi:8-oxo-dGTP pyrophosphatase MutT (NUDIX family)
MLKPKSFCNLGVKMNAYIQIVGPCQEEELKRESPEQAIVREVKEELGWDLRDYNLFKTIVENAPDQTIERHIYWGNISERVENLKLGEGAALKYFTPKKIPLLKVAFDLKPVIMDFLRTHASSIATDYHF